MGCFYLFFQGFRGNISTEIIYQSMLYYCKHHERPQHQRPEWRHQMWHGRCQKTTETKAKTKVGQKTAETKTKVGQKTAEAKTKVGQEESLDI